MFAQQKTTYAMGRPYIICHMVTSLDGKVTGDFLEKNVYSGLIDDYYRIHREYGADDFLCGRVTMEFGQRTRRNNSVHIQRVGLTCLWSWHHR